MHLFKKVRLIHNVARQQFEIYYRKNYLFSPWYCYSVYSYDPAANLGWVTEEEIHDKALAKAQSLSKKLVVWEG